MQQYSIADVESFCSRFYARADGTVPRLTIAPYFYNQTFLALAPGLSATNILQMQANADFMCLGISARANIALAAQTAGTIPLPLIRFLINDTGSNEQWMNQAIDYVNLTQSQSYLKPLMYPRIVSGRSSLSITGTNYSGTETYNFDLTFYGVRVQAY